MHVKVVQSFTSGVPKLGLIDHIRGKPSRFNGAVDINGDSITDTTHGNAIYGLMLHANRNIAIRPFNIGPSWGELLPTLLQRFKYITANQNELKLDAVTCSLGAEMDVSSFADKDMHIHDLRDSMPRFSDVEQTVPLTLIEAIEAVAKMMPVYIAQPPSRTQINFLTIAKGTTPVGICELQHVYNERQTRVASDEQFAQGIHTIFPVDRGFSFNESENARFIGENGLLDYRAYRYHRKLSELQASEEDVEKLSQHLIDIRSCKNLTDEFHRRPIINRESWITDKIKLAQLHDMLERKLGGVLFTQEQYLEAIRLNASYEVDDLDGTFELLSKMGTLFTYDLAFAFRTTRENEPMVYYKPDVRSVGGGVSCLKGSSFAAPFLAVSNLA